MVAKMEKFVFLAHHGDYTMFLNELRKLGLIHIAESNKRADDSDEFHQLATTVKQLHQAKQTLEKGIDKKNEPLFGAPNIELGKSIPQEIEQIQNQKAQLNQQLQVSVKERDTLQPWGDYDPENIQRLKRAGYYLNFFVVPDNQYNPEWEQLYDAVTIKREASKTYFVTVGKNSNVADELSLEAMKFPEISLSKLNELIVSLREKIELQDQKLKQLSANLPSVEAAIKEFEQKINFNKALHHTTSVADNKLMLLQGWAPEENHREISNYLDSKAVYYEVSAPTLEDDVPVELKNNRFSKLFEPITRMFALPTYSELDPTPFFAPFFMLFFGLCMGDAGYGLLILAAATFFKRKSKSADGKRLLELFQWFGGATFVVSTITGTFFGLPLFGVPLLKTFYENLLGAGTGANPDALAQLMQDKLMVFAVALGLVQIVFGMILSAVNIVRNQGFKFSIGRLAWIFVVVLAIVLFAFPGLGIALNDVAKNGLMYGIYGFIAVALLYNSPGKNIFLNIGTGLWNFYSLLTGIVGDALSYIRLFAIGLTGGILGGVFNQLALSMSEGIGFWPGRALVMLLILLIGHGINFGLCMISSLVHPMRLVFVEFYKNLQFTGGGTPYNPFGRNR